MMKYKLLKNQIYYDERLGRFVGINKKTIAPYGIGYYYDKQTKTYKVYENSERQYEHVRLETQSKQEAVSKLIEIIDDYIKLKEKIKTMELKKK